jgi:hypothetical protein
MWSGWPFTSTTAWTLVENLLESGPEHWIGAPFPTGGILVRPCDRCVEQAASWINPYLQRLEDAFPVARLGPVGEAVVDGLPVSVAVGQIPPRTAGLHQPDNGIQETAVTPIRPAPMARQQGLDLLPLHVGQLMAVHSSSEPPLGADASF